MRAPADVGDRPLAGRSADVSAEIVASYWTTVRDVPGAASPGPGRPPWGSAPTSGRATAKLRRNPIAVGPACCSV